MVDGDRSGDGAVRIVPRLHRFWGYFFCHSCSLRSVVYAMSSIAYTTRTWLVWNRTSALFARIRLAIGSNDIVKGVEDGIFADQPGHLGAVQFGSHFVVNF